jgi:hypothetical protein
MEEVPLMEAATSLQVDDFALFCDEAALPLKETILAIAEVRLRCIYLLKQCCRAGRLFCGSVSSAEHFRHKYRYSIIFTHKMDLFVGSGQNIRIRSPKRCLAWYRYLSEKVIFSLLHLKF